MKVKAAIKKTKAYFKKQGIDIEVHSPTNGGHRWWFQHGNEIGSWSVNGMHADDPNALEGDCCLFHRRRADDHDDLMSDYHAGSFRDNLTQVLHSILPPPPKFTPGQLVRGKSNKRATRHGFAGRVGLVMPSGGGGYIKVAWHGESQPRYGWPSISDRDVELIS